MEDIGEGGFSLKNRLKSRVKDDVHSNREVIHGLQKLFGSEDIVVILVVRGDTVNLRFRCESLESTTLFFQTLLKSLMN